MNINKYNYMNTRSSIAYMIDIIENISSMNKQIHDLMENYQIKDNVFVFKNNVLEEIVSGYFQVIEESNDINELVKKYFTESIKQQKGIRIIDNNTYQLGVVYKYLNECSEDQQIFDIECNKNVR